MPKISIITTTYKHKDFIKYTIESILSQTFRDWELLIWDDSPDDLTWNIIENYVKKYPDKIKAWHHFPNKWIVDNMNFLLEKVSSESKYIAFLEWDDMFTPDNLEEKVEIFNKYPDIKLIYSDLSFINAKNEIILESFFKQRNIKNYQNKIIDKNSFILSPAWPIASWSTSMIEKDTLNKYKIISLEPENKKYSVSDYDLYFKVATENKVYWINKTLTLYRRHFWNLSWSNWWTSDDLDKLIDYYYHNSLITSKIYKNKKSWTKIVSAIFDLEIWNKKFALKNLKNSLKYNFLSFPTYKLAIIFFLIMPNFFNKIILRKLIKRW